MWNPQRVPLAWARVGVATLRTECSSSAGGILDQHQCSSRSDSSHAQHHFSSLSPVTPSQEQQQQPQRKSSTPARSCSPSADWDWEWVLGRKKGRKPAIKSPNRHQWWYCNPNYDPNQALPTKMLSPYAPPSAAYVDDWAIYKRYLPKDRGLVPKYRENFIKFMRLREVDWRDAFLRGLAADVKEIKKEYAKQDEASRQRAWGAYRDKLFADALAGGKIEGAGQDTQRKFLPDLPV